MYRFRMCHVQLVVCARVGPVLSAADAAKVHRIGQWGLVYPMTGDCTTSAHHNTAALWVKNKRHWHCRFSVAFTACGANFPRCEDKLFILTIIVIFSGAIYGQTDICCCGDRSCRAQNPPPAAEKS